MPNKAKVTNELVEDKAKRDASYEYGKSSAEPAAEGAFKGALASGLASRLLKSKSRKKEALLLAAGTAAGALAGKTYNDKKVEKANSARKWLSDKNKERAYAKANKTIYKTANIEDDAGKAIRRAAEEKAKEQSEKRSASDIVGSATLGGTLGATLGAVAGTKFKMAKKFLSLNKAKAASGAIRTGALGATGVAAEDVVSNAAKGADEKTRELAGEKKRGTKDDIAIAGLSGAAMGATEPVVNKAFGKYYASKKGSDITKKPKVKVKPDSKLRAAARYIPFGDEGSENKAISSGIKSAKNKTRLSKGLLKPTLKAASRFGLGGAALAYGVNKLLDKSKEKKNLKKESAVNFTAKEAIRSEESSSRDALASSRASSLARKAGIAGLGYVVGNKIGGHNTGKAIAGLTLAYSAPKMISEEMDRSNAKEFLGKSKGQKLSHMKEKMDKEHFGTSDVALAYTTIRGIDHVWNSVTNNNDNSKRDTARKKFSIDRHI